MQANLEKSLVAVINSWIAMSIRERQPRFCCEINVISHEDAVALVSSIVNSWNSKIALVTGVMNGREYSMAVSLPIDQGVIFQMFENEGTLSVTDLTRLGGCVFDVSGTEVSNDTLDFLAAAWGEHEDSLLEIKKIKKDAEFFRGN